MNITDRIHCDNLIVPCRKNKIKKAKKRKNIPLNMEALKKKFSKYILNYKKDPEDERDYRFKNSFTNLLEAEENLPDRVDHTDMMSPVKNQGQLGSCVGFAVTAMKEWQEKHENEEELAKGKRGRKKQYDYSEAWVYWNSKKIDPWPNEEGTSIRYAMKVLQKIGVPTEKGWPYKDVGDIGEPKKWADLVARWALIDSYYRIDTLTELKLALIDGPVPIGIPCFYEFFFVRSDGYVPMPANPNQIYGGHAICTVGYNNKTKLIKFKNSWGTDWGANGYGYLPYDYVLNYLWDAWAARDLRVTREMLKGDRSL